MFSPFNKLTELDTEALKQLVDEVITPVAVRLGLEKKDDYLWYRPGSEIYRPGLKYYLLKGNQATLAWGICANYIPVISGSSLKFYRTEKSYNFHLFEWTDEYNNSLYGDGTRNKLIVHEDLKSTKNAISKTTNEYETRIRAWFDKASSQDGLIELAESQINIGKQYNLHHPNPKYILAYLYAQAQMKASALSCFDNLDLSLFKDNEDVRDKAYKHLIKLMKP